MAVGRARAEDRARAWAAPQWREHRLVRVVVTATATWCCVEGQWICFPHDAVLEYYVDGSTVVMAFAECARLALTGRAARTHTVIFTYARYSDTSWQDAPWRHPLTKLQPATSGRVQQLS
jgi:hypothetical protein